VQVKFLLMELQKEQPQCFVVLDRFQCNNYFYIRHSLTCLTSKVHADSDLVNVEDTTFCTDFFGM